MSAQPDVLLNCYQATASAARPALERCIDQAVTALQTLETQSLKLAVRDALADSWRHLLTHKKAWAERYASELLVALTQPASAKLERGTGADLRLLPSGFDAFRLVDDADLKQKIEAQRLLQDLLPATEQSLTELDALVSSALGLHHIAPEQNPLRPELFTRTLQQLLSASPDNAVATQLSLKHIAKPLGRELHLIYQQAIRALKSANIVAVGYQYRIQPSAPAPLKQSGFGTQQDPANNASNNASDSADFDGNVQPVRRPERLVNFLNQRVKAGLLHDFLLNAGGHAVHDWAAPHDDSSEEEWTASHVAADSAASGNAAFTSDNAPFVSSFLPMSPSAQARLALMPAVDRPQRSIDSSTPLNEQVWGPYGTSRARTQVRTQLKKEATKVSQVLGLDVVRELVNYVAKDPRLLTPVREAIVALEPSLLRLAMVDPRFFSDERHVGRQLMERVAQRSFKYNDEFSPEFAVFYQALALSVNQLNATAVEDTQPFRTALETLEHAWNTQDQQDLDKRQQAVQRLRFAEARQDKANQIAFDLSNRSDLANVPGVVLDFLFGTWSLAMANAKLLDERNQVDPEGYGSVVPDLVWSVKRDVTLKQPAKLIEMIPGLLGKLHSGLAMLGQDPQDNEAFFESLMLLHRPVLKLRRLKSQRDAEESNMSPLEAGLEVVSPAERLEKLRAQATAPLWMGRHDLDAAGFEDSPLSQPADVAELIAPPSQANALAAGEGVEITLPTALAEPALPLPVEPQSEAAKEQAAMILSRLKTGCWVDLYSKRQWLRAQLIWASSHATLFMFISHGGQPHSMTKRSCEKLIAQRLLRPVGTQGVVAQALDAVVEAAAQNHAASTQAAVTQGELAAI